MNKSQMTYDQLMCECENAIDDFAKSKFSLYRRLIVLKPAKKYAAKIISNSHNERSFSHL